MGVYKPCYIEEKIKKVELIAFSIIRRPRKRKRGGLRPVSDVLPLRKRTSTPYNTYSIENATLPQQTGMTRITVFIISNCTTNPPSSRLHPSLKANQYNRSYRQHHRSKQRSLCYATPSPEGVGEMATNSI